METVLIDTNILIGRFRNEPVTLTALKRVKGSSIVLCDAVVAELLAGVRSKKEYEATLREITKNFHILPFTMEVSTYFRTILFDVANKQGVHLADYLIAAIALAHDVPLLTLNQKHFKSIKGLKLV